MGEKQQAIGVAYGLSHGGSKAGSRVRRSDVKIEIEFIPVQIARRPVTIEPVYWGLHAWAAGGNGMSPPSSIDNLSLALVQAYFDPDKPAVIKLE